MLEKVNLLITTWEIGVPFPSNTREKQRERMPSVGRHIPERGRVTQPSSWASSHLGVGYITSPPGEIWMKSSGRKPRVLLEQRSTALSPIFNNKNNKNNIPKLKWKELRFLETAILFFKLGQSYNAINIFVVKKNPQIIWEIISNP